MSDLKRRKLAHEGSKKTKAAPKPPKEAPPQPSSSDDDDDQDAESSTLDAGSAEEVSEPKTFADLVSDSHSPRRELY